MGWLTGIFVGLFLSCSVNSIALLVFIVYAMENELFTWKEFTDFVKEIKKDKKK